MPRLSLWHGGRHSADFAFLDRSISEYFGISGTSVFVHLYLGPYLGPNATVDRDGANVPAYDPASPLTVSGDITDLQDPVLLEIRDRHYSPNTIEMRMIYNMADLDFNLQQFGLFLNNDTLYLECHLNDMLDQCGRKIIVGDILELPHRRDTGLDPANQIAVNKFYEVTDVSRSADGYSATWWPHIWRMKVTPMMAGQETQDILNLPATDALGLPLQPPETLGDVMSTGQNNVGINNAIDAAAKASVGGRYFQTNQYWMVTPEASSLDFPWVFAGDGIPPNGAVLLGSSNTFPLAPNQGDYYLRTDYSPATLFQWTGAAWQIQEQSYRPDWSAAHRVLLEFINNTNTRHDADGSTKAEKTNLSRAVRPQANF